MCKLTCNTSYCWQWVFYNILCSRIWSDSLCFVSKKFNYKLLFQSKNCGEGCESCLLFLSTCLNKIMSWERVLSPNDVLLLFFFRYGNRMWRDRNMGVLSPLQDREYLWGGSEIGQDGMRWSHFTIINEVALMLIRLREMR